MKKTYSRLSKSIAKMALGLSLIAAQLSFSQAEDHGFLSFGTTMPNGSTKINTVCNGAEPGENPGDTGCITLTYDGTIQTYKTVRAADGNIWLQQNLGSTAIASQVNDAASYGDLFQWGRWADGHQKRTSETVSVTPNPNNPLGLESVSGAYITSSPGWWATNALTDQWTAADVASIDAANSCDPCKALGEGWKLPTQEDWTTVVDAEDIGNPATAFASTLKLPANGYRSSSNGGFTFVGQRGYYWSSTSTGAGGKFLYIGSTLANPGSGAMRGQGAGIRCVKYATAVTCPVVETFSYNFDDFTTFPEQCWTASHTGFMFSVVGTNDKAVQIYSFTSPNDEFFMISPAVSTIDGQHALKFDVKAIAEGSKIQVGTLTSQTDFSEFAAIGDPFTPSLQDSYVSIGLPAIQDHQYVAIKFIPNGIHKNVSIDNVKWDLVANLGTGSFEKQTISLYPNPTNDFVMIQSNELIKQVQIYNQLGQLIGTKKSNTVDLSSYASGVYLLQIELDNSIITTIKVIKK